MGNSAYLGIEIENNGSICGGGKMRGKLLLDIRKVTSADFLMFRFYGHERTRISYTETYHEQDKTVTVEKTATEKASIFSSEVVLHRFAGGSVEKGRFAFPFEVSIPSGLPGTQRCLKGGNYCGIEYFCAAKLHRPGMFAWEVKNSTEVFMNDEPYEAFPVPLFLGPSTSKVCFMGMFPRGTMTFGGKVNTSNACGNEILRVNYAIHNESTSRVKALEFDITCEIAFRAASERRSYSNSIFHKRIKVSNMNGIEPLKRIGERKVDFNALLNQLNEGEYGIDIPIDREIRSTYNSQLSSVKYELSITIMTTYGSKNSTIRVPIIMHRRGTNFNGQVPAVGEAFPMPKGWTAIMVPTAELILEDPAVELAADYDTVHGLTAMVKASNQWQEINVLKGWLAHSPYNVNLLMPDTMFPIFQCIKGDYSIYTFCRALGEAMNAPSSLNKCTCRHIAEAAKAVPKRMKVPVCSLFVPYCTDRQNAPNAFRVIVLDDVELSTVLLNYQ